MKNKKRIKLNKFNVAVIIFMVLFVLSCFVDTGTYSRYAVENKTETVAVPATYYFESNYLMSENLTTPTYTVYSTDVTVTVKNNDGVNYTNDTISYDMSITTDNSGSAWKIYDEDGKILSTGTGNYSSADNTLFYDSANPKQNVSNTYVISADKGTTVTVAATSTAPYEETITANFYFDDANNKTFCAFVDMGYYCVLQVYTGTNVLVYDNGEDDGNSNVNNVIVDGNGDVVNVIVDDDGDVVLVDGDGEVVNVSVDSDGNVVPIAGEGDEYDVLVASGSNDICVLVDGNDNTFLVDSDGDVVNVIVDDDDVVLVDSDGDVVNVVVDSNGYVVDVVVSNGKVTNATIEGDIVPKTSISVKYDSSKLAPNNMESEMADWFVGTYETSETYETYEITDLSPHSYYEYIFYKNNYIVSYKTEQFILSDDIIDLSAWIN